MIQQNRDQLSWIMGCKDASCASHHRSKQGFGTVNVGSCYEEKTETQYHLILSKSSTPNKMNIEKRFRKIKPTIWKFSSCCHLFFVAICFFHGGVILPLRMEDNRDAKCNVWSSKLIVGTGKVTPKASSKNGDKTTYYREYIVNIVKNIVGDLI